MLGLEAPDHRLKVEAVTEWLSKKRATEVLKSYMHLHANLLAGQSLQAHTRNSIIDQLFMSKIQQIYTDESLLMQLSLIKHAHRWRSG